MIDQNSKEGFKDIKTSMKFYDFIKAIKVGILCRKTTQSEKLLIKCTQSIYNMKQQTKKFRKTVQAQYQDNFQLKLPQAPS